MVFFLASRLFISLPSKAVSRPFSSRDSERLLEPEDVVSPLRSAAIFLDNRLLLNLSSNSNEFNEALEPVGLLLLLRKLRRDDDKSNPVVSTAFVLEPVGLLLLLRKLRWDDDESNPVFFTAFAVSH